MFCHDINNQGRGELPHLVWIDDILECILSERKVQLLLIQTGICHHFVERALQLPDIRFNVCGDILYNLIINLLVIHLSIFAQDCHTCLIIRRLDICDQTPLKTGAEALLQSLHFFWRFIGGYNNLLSSRMKDIERVKKLFLSGLLSYYKLYVVYQKDIDRSVLVAQLCHHGGITASDRFDHLVGKLFRSDIQHLFVLVLLQHKMADGVHQVGFPKSGAAVQIKGIVCLTRRFRYSERCGVCKFIVVSHDKGIKLILVIQIRCFMLQVISAFFRLLCVILRLILFSGGIFLCDKYDIIFMIH